MQSSFRLGAFLLFFCLGLPFASATVKDDKKLTIGFSVYTQLQPRWLFDVEAFVAQAKKNGDTVVVQYADGDASKQSQQVKAMINSKVDVLVIASADIVVGAGLIELARKDGIKTIAYDISVKDAAPDLMIGRNQSQVGTLQVEAALKEKPVGNYAILKGDPSNDLAQVSNHVYAEALSKKHGINVMHNDYVKGFSPVMANRIAREILASSNKKIDAFIVNNDGMATGVVQALREANMTGKVFVSGLDADEVNLNLIATGVQTMTVYTPIDIMARKAAVAAHELGNGRVPVSTRIVQHAKGPVLIDEVRLVSVTKQSLCYFISKIAPKGWANPQAVFKGSDLKCD
ncbi:MAG: substrate-binding domain-containing protein [Pseudomonadota bacterium]